MGPLAHTHNQAVQPLSGQLQVVSGIIGQQQVVSGAPVQPQMVSGVPGPLVMMYPGQPQLVQTASPQYLVTPAVPAVIQMAQPQNPTPDTDQAVIQTVPPQYSATTDAASGEWDPDRSYNAAELLCRIGTQSTYSCSTVTYKCCIYIHTSTSMSRVSIVSFLVLKTLSPFFRANLQ